MSVTRTTRIFRDQQTPPLTATIESVTNFARSGATVFITRDGRTVYNTR